MLFDGADRQKRHVDLLEALLGLLLLPDHNDAIGDDVHQAVGVDDDALLQCAKRVVLDWKTQFNGLFLTETATNMLFHHRRDGRGKTQGRTHFGADLAVLDRMGLGLAQVVEQCPTSDQLDIDRFVDPGRDLQGFLGVTGLEELAQGQQGANTIAAATVQQYRLIVLSQQRIEFFCLVEGLCLAPDRLELSVRG